MDRAKPFCIAKREVWEAYKQVKANRGAAGVDGQSIEDFDRDLGKNLYRIWNRMSSGSYFPPPVRRVDIPKGDTGAPACRGGKSELHRAVCRITSGTPIPQCGTGGRPVPQKTYRLRFAGKVRVKRCGKSAPLEQQCSGQGKPHTEQDQIGRESASADTHRLGALEPSGRSHERGSNVTPRGMIVIPVRRDTEFGLQVHCLYLFSYR